MLTATDYRPRDYQAACVDSIFREFDSGVRSTLVVSPTGTGKTAIFGFAARRWLASIPRARVLVCAHREELIWQAHEKLDSIIGEPVEIEMADLKASTHALEGVTSRVFVASVQSLANRLQKYQPHEPWLVIVDEAQHAIPRNKQYNSIVKHFAQSDYVRIIGVTATPDRLDEEALGQLFHSVAFDYSLPDAIKDGWLVRPRQKLITVDGLDLSRVKIDKGDLSADQLDQIISQEEILHKFVSPTIKESMGRPTLVFTPGVHTAHAMAEVFNRHAQAAGKPEAGAVAIDGKTPKDIRRNEIRRFKNREFQYLLNCAIFLEGFDADLIEVIAMARPTSSRALYSQMCGRGTRPVRMVSEDGMESIGVDDFADPISRRDYITGSPKPSVTILDFVGNACRHKLINTHDILGGKDSDEVVELAKKISKDKSAKGLDSDTLEDLEQARLWADDQRREARRKIIADAIYTMKEVDPFDLLEVSAGREPGYLRGKPATPKQIGFLKANGVRNVEGLSLHKAKALIDEVMKRKERGLANPKQANVLAAHGYLTKNVTAEQAAEHIREINEKLSGRNGSRK
jgi:superfamily II DNA or RNA helicase